MLNTNCSNIGQRVGGGWSWFISNGFEKYPRVLTDIKLSKSE